MCLNHPETTLPSQSMEKLSSMKLSLVPTMLGTAAFQGHTVSLGSVHHTLVVLHINTPPDFKNALNVRTTDVKLFTQEQMIPLNLSVLLL